jgi:hypothetical protein
LRPNSGAAAKAATPARKIDRRSIVSSEIDLDSQDSRNEQIIEIGEGLSDRNPVRPAGW